MTLEAYDPDRLDALSLRVLDVCGRLRHVARVSREEELPPIALNDRKALEVLARLEEWVYRVEAELHRSVQKNHGRRAREMRTKPTTA
jgi:hypothetical protein